MRDEPHPCEALTEANTCVHDAIEQALLDVLEGITALDITATRGAWDHFQDALEQHAVFEEARVFPRYAALGNHPRGGGPELFEADHTSLRKVTAAAIEAIERVYAAESDRRRVMVTELGPLVRLRNVLEHHTLREERFLYPRLDAELPPAERDTLVSDLRESTASPHGRSSG